MCRKYATTPAAAAIPPRLGQGAGGLVLWWLYPLPIVGEQGRHVLSEARHAPLRVPEGCLSPRPDRRASRLRPAGHTASRPARGEGGVRWRGGQPGVGRRWGGGHGKSGFVFPSMLPLLSSPFLHIFSPAFSARGITSSRAVWRLWLTPRSRLTQVLAPVPVQTRSIPIDLFPRLR